jgi:hypothetical protein
MDDPVYVYKKETRNAYQILDEEKLLARRWHKQDENIKISLRKKYHRNVNCSWADSNEGTEIKLVKTAVFWDVATCSLVDDRKRFVRICCSIFVAEDQYSDRLQAAQPELNGEEVTHHHVQTD